MGGESHFRLKMPDPRSSDGIPDEAVEAMTEEKTRQLAKKVLKKISELLGE